jgi:hypothetical protein
MLQLRLSEYLGDEVFGLFLGVYIDQLPPKIVTANEYDPHKISKKMKEKIKKLLSERKELRYG